jgi:hypothetical protein
VHYARVGELDQDVLPARVALLRDLLVNPVSEATLGRK